ncbi:MAG: PQQ-binding-like beta-propeller repeat protein [Planctomycetales bacterium]|nr:PQQ-binding-like beta-propeller repeat protein [Planctomycetales bacterium]
MVRFCVLFFCILSSHVVAEPATESDWPQWQGPNRNAISNQTGLLTEWPEGGPPLAWKRDDIGGGYGAPAISAGRMYGLSNRGDDEVVWAFSEKDGTEIWAQTIGPAAKQGMRQGIEGPGCTPTVDGDRLYVIGAGGTVACLQTDDGKVVWTKGLIADFGGQIPMWRYNESPLIDGEKLICTPGGDAATLVALNKSTGDVVWKSKLSQENPEAESTERENVQRDRTTEESGPKPVVVLAAGSRWKYLDTGADPGDDWTKPDFDDQDWKEGAAQFGYGDNDEKTKLDSDANNYPTYYFRKSFEIDDPNAIKPLVVRLIKDDGAIVYLNGEEVVRDNMPDGKVTREMFAEETTAVESEFYLHDLNSQLLTGRNVIAVEVHQASATSSDVSFDLELREKLPSDRTGVPPASRNRGSGFGGGGRGGSEAAYSSAIAIDFEGQRQYVQLTATTLVGVSATDGKVLWKYERAANRNRINCSTPIFHDGLIFAASAYGNGGGAVRLKKKDDGTIEAEEVYFTTRMQNHHGGMIVHDGALYGANGGNGGGLLACLDFQTGDVLWRDRKAPKGSLAMADNRLYLYSEEGEVMLIEPNREKLIERGRFSHPGRSQSPAWTHPVIANGKLYIRDQNLLLCYDVSAK